MSRLSIDITEAQHRFLKTYASSQSTTIKRLFLTWLENLHAKSTKERKPNRTTRRAFKNSDKGKGLTYYKSVDDMFEKLDLK